MTFENRYLIVSTFPPEKCGIATYAQQHFEYLVNKGFHVVRIGNNSSEADVKLNFKSLIFWVRMLKLTSRNDTIIFHFDYSFFFQEKLRWLGHFNLLFLQFYFLKRPSSIVYLHEFPNAKNLLLRKIFIPNFLKSIPKYRFFSNSVARELFSYYRIKMSTSRYEIVAHNEVFKKITELKKEDARKILGIESNLTLLISVGFISHNKNFEVVVNVLKEFESISSQIQYLIIGHTKQSEMTYLSHLKYLISGRTNVKIVERYLTDEEFDCWIVASDYVVLPYKEIRSSGVLGRAKLYNRTVIAKQLENLLEELSEGDLSFKTEPDLKRIIEGIRK